MQIVSHEIPLLVSSSHTMQYSPINDYKTQWGKFGIKKIRDHSNFLLVFIIFDKLFVYFTTILQAKFFMLNPSYSKSSIAQ